MDKDPFGYPLVTYVWVTGLAAIASAIRHLNDMDKFSGQRLLIDALSGGFTGLLTFWLCEWSNISGPLSAFLIGVSGLMGARAWQTFMELLRLKIGLSPNNGQMYNPPPASNERTGDTK